MIGLAPDGVVASWSEPAERLLGYTHQDAVGRHVSFLCTVEDRRLGLPDRSLGEARDQETSHHVGWEVRKDGSRFWGSVQVVALHSGGGELLGFAEVIRELPLGVRTDGYEETLAAQLMDDFHDTLAVVRGFSELASAAEPDERRHFRGHVEASADRLLALTEGLVAWSRQDG